jgi:hypothetical protein
MWKWSSTYSCSLHYRKPSVRYDLELSMDGTGSGSCRLEGFGISGVEPSGSAASVSIIWQKSSLRGHRRNVLQFSLSVGPGAFIFLHITVTRKAQTVRSTITKSCCLISVGVPEVITWTLLRSEGDCPGVSCPHQWAWVTQMSLH